MGNGVGSIRVMHQDANSVAMKRMPEGGLGEWGSIPCDSSLAHQINVDGSHHGCASVVVSVYKRNSSALNRWS